MQRVRRDDIFPNVIRVGQFQSQVRVFGRQCGAEVVGECPSKQLMHTLQLILADRDIQLDLQPAQPNFRRKRKRRAEQLAALANFVQIAYLTAKLNCK